MAMACSNSTYGISYGFIAYNNNRVRFMGKYTDMYYVDYIINLCYRLVVVGHGYYKTFNGDV